MKRSEITSLKAVCVLLFSMLAFSSHANGQFARFSADTNNLRKLLQSNQHAFDKALQMQWKINGNDLIFGSLPVDIKPDPNTVDTILFRTDTGSQWNTIICNIRKPGNYEFSYNTCCGGFYLRDLETKRFTTGSVFFRVVNAESGQPYLGTLGEAAMFIPILGDTVFPNCRSAMSSNIYQVIFGTAEFCADTSCDQIYCEVTAQNEIIYNDQGLRFIDKQGEFLFMPIDSEPLVVIFDAKNRTFTVR